MIVLQPSDQFDLSVLLRLEHVSPLHVTLLSSQKYDLKAFQQLWRYICKPLGHFVNCSRVLFVLFSFVNLLGLVYVVFFSVNSYFWILVIVKLNVNPNSLNTIYKIQSAYWTPHVSNILFLILIWLACHHTFLIIIVNAYTIILHDDSIHRKITKYVIILLWTYTIDF